MATDRQIQAYQIARTSLTAFKQIVHRNYQRALHLDTLDRFLVQVSRYVETGGQHGIGRLVIEMPPRHGKTLTTSRLYPTWHIGRNPDHRAMLVSYGASLAYKNSRAARNYIRTNRYRPIFPHVQVSDDSSAVNSWQVADYEGGVDAMGIGGDPTGKGAHLLIIDDPVKNRAEAESEIYRERNWNAFTSDLYSRLEPGAAIIIMSTRWHMADLTGMALEMADEGWVQLRLPALAEDDDPLGRDSGAALWPMRYPAPRLHQIRNAVGEYDFSSLYQQKPLPSKGGLFDTSKIVTIDHAPACKRIVRFYDLAVTAKKHSDYTAGVKLGITDNEDLIILHVYREQKRPSDVATDIIHNAGVDSRNVAIRLETEKAGIVQLDYLLSNAQLRGYTLDGKPPIGDKYTRAQPFASRVNAEKVKMVRGIWNRAFLDELAVFPMGKHDDQVDAASGAYEMLSDVQPHRITIPDIFGHYT